MQGVVKSGKSLKLWQMVVLFAVLLGGAGATYLAYARIGGSNGSGLEDNQQIIPVQYGNLVNQVSTNGSLIFPNRETLTFGIQGTVGEVLVEDGQVVKEGQPLAMLDATTVASLEKAVAQARVNLRDAQEELDAASDMSEAREAAQSKVDTTTISLSNAQRDLLLAQKQWAQKLEDATEAIANAQDAYRQVFSKYLDIAPTDEELGQGPNALLETWGIDLDVLFDPGLRFQDTDKGWTAQGIPPDDPATPWSEPLVFTWMNLFPGSLVPTCEEIAISPLTTCIMKEVEAAWDALQSALDSQETVDLQAINALNNAGSAVTRAEDTLADAEEALADVMAEPDSLVVGLKEAELTSAQVALDTAIERLEASTLKAPTDSVVYLLNVEAGQSVIPNTPVVEVVDPTVIELDGIVDEIDVLFVREGANAVVIMDALPDQVLEGTVSEIASAAQSQQGVVSYAIRIQVQVPEGVELREGLSATASIVIREELNALLVPLQALYGSFEQPVVRVMLDGVVEERPVVLGNSDDFWVAVRQGLAEGDQVVMEAQQATTSQFGFGSSFGGGQFRRSQGGQVPGALPGGGGSSGGQRSQPTPVPRR